MSKATRYLHYSTRQYG